MISTLRKVQRKLYRISLVAQMVKHPPTMRETRVWFLGRDDPLEKEMGTHSSILAWRIPWMEEPGRLQSTGSQRVGHNWATSLSNHRTKIQPPASGKLQLLAWYGKTQPTPSRSTSFRTPWTSQPAVSGTSPIHQWFYTSSGPLGWC